MTATRETVAALIHNYVKHICVGEHSPGDVVAYKRGVGVVFTGDTGGNWRLQLNGYPGSVSWPQYGNGAPIRIPARKVGQGWDIAMLVSDESADDSIREIMEHGK